ncbi:MAG: competence/damage-inducible protein A [Candidatus Izemoplasmataceae bacterium]
MDTVVVTVGKEVLSGKTVNTNLRDIAILLSAIGLEIKKSFVIDDDIEEYHKILDIIDEELVIFTGGLGPTVDDLTREAVYQYYQLETYIDENVLTNIREYFDRRNQRMTNANLKQAMFPIGSRILENHLGTAPGVCIDVNEQHIILLPGPPREMRPMLEKVIEYLKDKVGLNIYSEGFKLVGTGESAMEEKLEGFYEQHPNVRIAPYASLGEIKYIFTSTNFDDLKSAKDAFYDHFKEYVYGSINDTLEEVVVSLLRESEATVSTAESCTGGLLASNITSVPGASSVFKEGLITYSNEAKMKYLNVSEHTLKTEGAVSEACVIEMAKNLAKQTNATYTIAISGIAGPSGGTKEKPVGLVYFGLCYDGKVYVERQVFNGNRTMVQSRAAIYALNMLRKVLIYA